jgi:tripeptidyl-peptidase-1
MASLTRASNEGISTVVKWLNLTGATNIETSPARDNILFTTTVERAGSMMNTEFLEYRHADTDTTKVRTTRIDLPQAVAPYIQSMHPTTFFDRDDGPGRQFLHAEATSMEPAAGSALFQCSDTGAKHKPEDLANRYSMPPQPNSKTPNPDKTGRFGVVGFNDYFPRFRDVQSFKEAFKISPNAFYGSLGINGKIMRYVSITVLI